MATQAAHGGAACSGSAEAKGLNFMSLGCVLDSISEEQKSLDKKTILQRIGKSLVYWFLFGAVRSVLSRQTKFRRPEHATQTLVPSTVHGSRSENGRSDLHSQWSAGSLLLAGYFNNFEYIETRNHRR